jgi:hypothetical protein
VSRFRWRNESHFGGFRGKEEMMLKYYAAHFDIANWGAARLGLAIPEGGFPLETVTPCSLESERHEDTVTSQHNGQRCIVWWERNEKGG